MFTISRSGVVFRSQKYGRAIFLTFPMLFLALATFFAPAPAQGAGLYWSVTSGDWSIASNWGGTVPTSIDVAYITNGGTATITQYGENCSYLVLGNAAKSSGSAEMTAGQLVASYEYIGNSGTGAFMHTGGTNSMGYFQLGRNAGSSGTYSLSGTGYISAENEYIGYNGIGMFTQTGGTNFVSSLNVGLYSGSSGTYTLSGTGYLSVREDEYIGSSGSGVFTQTGGTHTVSSSIYAFYLGYAPGSSGIYNLSDTGLLSIQNEFIGVDGVGIFHQTGGTHSVALLTLGAKGQYYLSGGTLNVIGGFDNQGTLDCENGDATFNASGPLIFDFTQGSILNAHSATLNLPAGSLAIVSSGLDPTDIFGSYHNSGMTHVAGTTLTITADQSIGGIGTINDPVVCSGTINATSGGGINLNNGLALLDNGNINLGTGQLIIEDAVSSMGNNLLNVGSQYVGNKGTGVFTQSGGTNSNDNGLYLGYNDGSTGTYILNNASRLYINDGSEYIGYSGTGAFTQTGGTNYIVKCAVLGYNSGSSGSYSLTGSSYLLVMSDEVIGRSGSGVFTQINGRHSAADDLFLGYNSGSNGKYYLNGEGSLYTGSNGYIGYSGTGSFMQSGGTHIINDNLYLGYNAGSIGTYNLSGTATLRSYDSDYNSLIECIGYYGTGTFTQDGGSNSCVQLLVGANTGSIGTYIMSGPSQLSANYEYIGNLGTGSFTQNGGTNSSGWLFSLGYSAGSTGTYSLSGSGLLSTKYEYIGYNGSGFLTQKSGVNAVSFLAINSTSQYNISGGTLAIAGGLVNAGTFDCQGGTVAINAASGSVIDLINNSPSNTQNSSLYVAPGSLLMIASGYDPSQHFSSYVNQGSTYVSGTTFTLASNQSLFTAGSFDDLVVCSGTIFTPNAATYSLNLNDGLILSGSGYVNLGLGSLTVNDTVSCITGGYLSLANQYVGKSKTGSFTQLTGVNTLSSTFYLGYNSGVTGSYALGGTASLAAVNEYVGYNGNGSFRQSGGTNGISSTLAIGYAANSYGSYILSGAAKLSGGTEFIGYSGNGAFSQTGGTNSVASSLYLGYNVGSTGSYTLGGSGSLICPTEYVSYNGSGVFTPNRRNQFDIRQSLYHLYFQYDRHV